MFHACDTACFDMFREEEDITNSIDDDNNLKLTRFSQTS